MTLPPTAPSVGPDPATVSVPPRIELRGISTRFGATAALTDVSMDLRAGEIHGLVGENGAGKSTLVKILAGVHAPDAGTILLGGAPILVHGPAPSRSLGIAAVHQEPQVFPDLAKCDPRASGTLRRMGAINRVVTDAEAPISRMNALIERGIVVTRRGTTQSETQ